MTQLPYEGKERVALAIYNAKPSEEEIKRGKKPAFLTVADVGEPFFVLTSGKLSSYYIDLRMLPAFPRLFNTIVAQLLWQIDTSNHSDADFIVSTESAGIPYGSVVGKFFNMPFNFARKEPKMHGTKKFIEGFVPYGSRGIIVDDLVTTLKTVKNAIYGAREEGGEVLSAHIVFNRRQYQASELESLMVPLYHLVDVFEFVEIGLKAGKISKEVAEQTIQYHRDEPAYAMNVIRNNVDFLRKHVRHAEILQGYENAYNTAIGQEKQGYKQVCELLKTI